MLSKFTYIQGTRVLFVSLDEGQTWHAALNHTPVPPTFFDTTPTVLEQLGPKCAVSNKARLNPRSKRKGKTDRTSEDRSPRKRTLMQDMALARRLSPKNQENRAIRPLNSASIDDSGYVTSANREELEKLVLGALGTKKHWLKDIKES